MGEDNSVAEAAALRHAARKRVEGFLEQALAAAGFELKALGRTGYDDAKAVTVYDANGVAFQAIAEPDYPASDGRIFCNERYTRFQVRPIEKLALHVRSVSYQFWSKDRRDDLEAAAAKVVAKLQEWQKKAPAWAGEVSEARGAREHREEFLLGLAARCRAVPGADILGMPRGAVLATPYGNMGDDSHWGREVTVANGLSLDYPDDKTPEGAVRVRAAVAGCVPVASVERVTELLVALRRLIVPRGGSHE